MDLLSGYGSSDEDDAHESSPLAPKVIGEVKAPAAGASREPSGMPRKRKRKKLVLPARIEAALAGGAGLNSDDSEDDAPHPIPRSGAGAGLDGLLAALPKPKAAPEKATIAVPKREKRPKTSTNGNGADAVAPREDSGHDEATVTGNAVAAPAPRRAATSAPSLGLVPNLSAASRARAAYAATYATQPASSGSSPAAAVAGASIPGFAASAAPRPVATHGAAALYTSSSLAGPGGAHHSLAGHAACLTVAAAAAGPPRAAALDPQAYTAGTAAQFGGSGGASSAGSGSGGGGGRRRERDVERQLAAGNFDALGPGMVVKTVMQSVPEYDALAAAPPPGTEKPEIKIAANFYNPGAGTTQVVHQPTRLQKRKHQINQLAAQAASMELDALDSRGHARAAKAQVRSKYGW